MKPIGGYFELADREQGEFIHKDGVLLNTGRNALEWILLSIGCVKKIYLPYYTCDVVLEPLRRLHIPWQYYHINEQLEVAEDIQPGEDEYVIVNNYFGVKDAYIKKMVSLYGPKMIVDCAQAFFAPVEPGIKTFYSARKFVGVADGGIAYGINGQLPEVEDESLSHAAHLFIRKELGAEAGFATYQKEEELLNNQPARKMSEFTQDILKHIDYNAVVKQRKQNYAYLERGLRSMNKLQLSGIAIFQSPIAYPLMVANGVELRKQLIEQKVFVPRFWPNEHIPEERINGYTLSETILPLPVDQRYGEEEMKRIVEIIKR